MSKVHHVLVVDDNHLNNDLCRFVMDKADFCEKATFKESSEAALEALAKLDNDNVEFPSIIFVDINMPGLDGFEFVSHYDRNGYKNRHPHTKIYMLTASNTDADIDKALENEVVEDYIIKPLSPEKLDAIS